MSRPLKVFITYARENRTAKNKLITCLKGMQREGLISIWHDNEIIAGDKWREEIFATNLPDSDLLLYLVSFASLESENCNRELGIALEKNIRPILIILEDCDWKNYQVSNVQSVSTEGFRLNEWESQKLGDIQALPAEGKPLNEWNPRSKGWQSVVDGLRKAIQTMLSQAELAFQQGDFLMTLRQIDKAIERYSHAINLNPNNAFTCNNRGVAYTNKGEFDKAIVDYTKAIELNPNFALAYTNRGTAYGKKADLARATVDFTESIQLNPNYAEAYNNRGLVYHIRGDYARAIVDYTKAIDLNPNYADAYINRGVACHIKGDYARAIEDYNMAIQQKPDSAMAYTNRGLAYSARGEVDHAIADYTKAIDVNPTYADAYTKRGAAYGVKHDYDHAIVDLNKAIDLNPDDANAYYNSGVVYVSKNDDVRALVNLNRAIELTPDFANAYYIRGNAYDKRDDSDRAIADYTKTIDLNPNHADAYYSRGNAYNNKGNSDRAIGDYTKAIGLNPNYAYAYNNRGNVYDKKGDYDRAIEDLNTAIRLNPNYANAYTNRGNAYGNKGNSDRAIEDHTKAIDLNPNHADAYFNRGNVYDKKGDYDRAIADYTKAIDLNPKHAHAYGGRGVVYGKKGKYDLAIKDFNTAIEFRSDYAVGSIFYYNRGYAYGKKGDYNRAIADYTKAIELRPDYAAAYYNRGEALLHLKEWEKAKSDLTTARDKGVDIIASFHNDHKNVETYERRNRVKLPEDIAAMLTQQRRNRFPKPQNFLRPDGTPFESSDVLNLLAKLRSTGTPLPQYVQTRSTFGLKTGRQETFVVDSAIRDQLIAEHPSSVDILKPFLRGRDIRRWQVARPDSWLIFTYRRIEINRYPAIRKHLEKYRSALSKRAGKQKWYELPATKSDAEHFAQTKLICPNRYDHQTFAVDTEGFYCGDTCYLIPTGETWLCGLLNSHVVEWFYWQTSNQSKGDYLRTLSGYMQQIPIPDLSSTQKALIGKIVDYLIYLQGQPTTNSGDLAHARDAVMLKYFERIIDGLVYESYLGEELHQGGKQFFKPLLDESLPQLEEIRGDKMSALREIFERLYERAHPVRRNLFFLDSVKSIRIIEGKA